MNWNRKPQICKLSVAVNIGGSKRCKPIHTFADDVRRDVWYRGYGEDSELTYALVFTYFVATISGNRSNIHLLSLVTHKDVRYILGYLTSLVTQASCERMALCVWRHRNVCSSSPAASPMRLLIPNPNLNP